MKRLTILSTLILSLLAFAVRSQGKKPIEKLFGDIAGTWRIQSIYDGKKDITKNDSSSVQWMEFTEDGRYRNKTGNQVLDSGSYRVNENHHSLYLQSDRDKDNPAEWQLEFKDNTMTLSGKGTSQAKRFKYIYVKTKERTNRPVKPQQ